MPFSYPPGLSPQNTIPPSFLKIYLAILQLRQEGKRVTARGINARLGWTSGGGAHVVAGVKRLRQLGLLTHEVHKAGTIQPLFRMEFRR